jgi:UDP-3-O-[3-hydroxymyristoyl] glucosamine N-acyltransferase
MKLSEIARLLQGHLEGDADTEITGLAKIEDAAPGDLTFVANPKYQKFLKHTKASAILVGKDLQDIDLPHIRVDDPYFAFLIALEFFNPPVKPNFTGIHPSSDVSDSAVIEEGVVVGPFVYIGERAVIRSGTLLYPGCVVMDDAEIGHDCVIFPHVSIREKCLIGSRVIIHNGTVIGSDGFGFAPTGDTYRKIPQMGRVVIEDDVEIGANCTIDRATLGETLIRKGCKLDNLIQIAHNVVIEANTVIAAQSGISGSTKIGRNVTIAGQVGTVGHITIGDKAIVAAKSGVSKDVPAGEVWFGYPAQPIMKQKKIEASSRHLPDMARKIHQLEKLCIELEEKIKKMDGGNEG